jgi:dihydroxyacetone kinase-like predicted kinase
LGRLVFRIASVNSLKSFSGFALSLETGVASAYKTMIKPMEGTMLTVVAKEAAKKAVVLAKNGASLQEVLEGVRVTAETALACGLGLGELDQIKIENMRRQIMRQS